MIGPTKGIIIAAVLDAMFSVFILMLIQFLGRQSITPAAGGGVVIVSICGGGRRLLLLFPPELSIFRFGTNFGQRRRQDIVQVQVHFRICAVIVVVVVVYCGFVVVGGGPRLVVVVVVVVVVAVIIRSSSVLVVRQKRT